MFRKSNKERHAVWHKRMSVLLDKIFPQLPDSSEVHAVRKRTMLVRVQLKSRWLIMDFHPVDPDHLGNQWLIGARDEFFEVYGKTIHGQIHFAPCGAEVVEFSQRGVLKKPVARSVVQLSRWNRFRVRGFTG